jgi:3-dehydroquinate synthase
MAKPKDKLPMEKILVRGQHSNSQILVGESLGNLDRYLPDKNIFVLTDTNILKLYGSAWDKHPCLALEPGEESKTLAAAARVYHWLMEQKADRSSFILGVGGGVVCDLAGFVASTYMRGVGFGFAATTLLAQVDASVGGKNGVNLDGYKNIIGTFNQPQFVICDPAMVKTLPGDEIRNGMAEVVKHALIADKSMFEILEQDPTAIYKLEPELLNYLVSRSVHIKSGIVGKDERETGERRKLNLGHTWGHAVEKALRLPHGYAVAVGMVFAGEMSVHRGLLGDADLLRLKLLLEKLGLPVRPSGNTQTIYEILEKDKKREGSHIHFVLNKGIGDVVVQAIPLAEIKSFIS